MFCAVSLPGGRALLDKYSIEEREDALKFQLHIVIENGRGGMRKGIAISFS